MKKSKSNLQLFFISDLSKSFTVALFVEQQERFAHSRSFVKSDKSESLPSLFKKEQLSKEQRERFALGHKKGKTSEKQSKTYKKVNH